MQCWLNFPIKSLLVHRAKPNLGQNYVTLSDDLLSEIFLEMLFKIGIQNCQFSQQIYLRNNGQFAPNLSQNYATLYRHLFGGAQ